MIKFLGKLTAAAAILIGMSVSAQAGEEDCLCQEGPSYVRIGAGYYDVFGDSADQTGTGHIEYIHGRPLIDYGFYRNFKPFFGVMGTGDSAGYVYAGVRYDWYVTDNIIIAPSFAPGAYTHGDGKDLGHGLEFRSAIEVAYEFENDFRLGASLYHLSNAGIGDKNPGTEVVTLHLSVPISE